MDEKGKSHMSFVEAVLEGEIEELRPIQKEVGTTDAFFSQVRGCQWVRECGRWGVEERRRRRARMEFMYVVAGAERYINVWARARVRCNMWHMLASSSCVHIHRQ